MLVLAVKLDEASRQILERAGGRQFAVDVRPAPALRRDLAANQQFFAARLEDRLDRRDILAGTNEVARGPAAQQEADGLDENGLAGAGFSGQDVEAGLELDLRGVDDREAFDAEKAQHGGKKSEKFNRNIGLTAVLRRATVLHTLGLPARGNRRNSHAGSALSQRRTN